MQSKFNTQKPKRLLKYQVVHALQKIKDEVEFGLGMKKRQTSLDPYFERELN